MSNSSYYVTSNPTTFGPQIGRSYTQQFTRNSGEENLNLPPARQPLQVHYERYEPRPQSGERSQGRQHTPLKVTPAHHENKMQRSNSGYIPSELKRVDSNPITTGFETSIGASIQSKLGEKIRQYVQIEHNEGRLSANPNG